jgi:polyhydroxyalkanoate synthesis regulator phasin
MTVFDVVRNAIMAGFGVQEKVKEFIDELVKKGELSESQGAKLVKDWTERADKTSSELGKIISDSVAKAVEKISIATKEDIERLNKEIQGISERIKKLEDKGSE